MSKIKEIELMILSNFKDGKIHSSEEYRKLAVEKGLISNTDYYSIRNTVHTRLRNNDRFEMIKRGKYIIHTGEENFNKIEENAEKESFLSVQEAFNYLENRLLEIENLDVINNSSEEIEQGIREIREYQKKMEELLRIMKYKMVKIK